MFRKMKGCPSWSKGLLIWSLKMISRQTLSSLKVKKIKIKMIWVMKKKKKNFSWSMLIWISIRMDHFIEGKSRGRRLWLGGRRKSFLSERGMESGTSQIPVIMKDFGRRICPTAKGCLFTQMAIGITGSLRMVRGTVRVSSQKSSQEACSLVNLWMINSLEGDKTKQRLITPS